MKSAISKTISIIIAILIMISISVSASAVDIDYMDKHGDEGKKLWNAYIDVLAPVKEGKYPELLDTHNYLSSSYKNRFESLTKRSEQEFLEMSNYDKLLWDTSVLAVFYESASYKDFVDWQRTYLIEAKNFKYYITDEDDYKKIYDAYLALMDWSYYYYESTGGFYNFIEDKDSFDYVNDYYDTDTSSKGKETSKDTEDSTSSKEDSTSSKDENSEKIEPSSQTSSVTTSSESNPESSKGIWSGFGESLKKHIVTVIIAILFLIALAYIAIQKKRYNINDSQE